MGNGSTRSGVHFKVELASHKTCAAEYDQNVEKFLNEERTLDGLAIYTPTGQSIAQSQTSHLYSRTRAWTWLVRVG